MLTQREDLSSVYVVSVRTDIPHRHPSIVHQAEKMGLDTGRRYDWFELPQFDDIHRKFKFIQERKDAWIVKGMENLSERIRS